MGFGVHGSKINAATKLLIFNDFPEPRP